MKNIINILISIVLAFILTGCEGFLDKAPILDQSTEITLSSYDGLNKAVAGAYAPFYSSAWYGGALILNAEMRSGNGWRKKEGKFQSGRYRTAYDWNYRADATSSQWGSSYDVIMLANNVFANLDGKTTADVSEQDINNLRAEVLFLRVLAHFNAVTLFAQPYSSSPDSPGIPYVKSTDPLGKPKRDAVSVVYDEMVADLLEAEKIIDADYVRKDFKDTKAFATKTAIQALLSRIYLYMEKWQEAANYASLVIESGKYRLWTPTEYVTVWGLDVPEAQGEIIYEVYGGKLDKYHGHWDDISYALNPNGTQGDVAASTDLLVLYEDTDVRGPNNFSMYRTDANNQSNGILWTKKYIGKGVGSPDANNVIVLRLSEMYLNRAEAILNGASIAGTSTILDLNIIRQNRGIADLTSAGFGDLRNERRLELAFEGHYLCDLARWKLPVVRTAFTGDLNKNIEFPSYRWALPIAQTELDVNENLVQNDGY